MLKNFFTAACGLFIVSSLAFCQEPIRVIPIGDSITAGFHGSPSGSYRQVVQERLDAVGTAYDFVGNFRRGNADVFDTDHQGIPGAAIAGTLETVGSPLQEYDPDFALILLGTNLHFSSPDSDFASDYRELFEHINENTSDISIVISTVPGFGDGFGSLPGSVDFRNEFVFPAINAGIRQAASEFENVTVVDLFSEFDIETDLASDGVHPNLFGQQKLGNLFADELISQISATSVSSIPEPSGISVVVGFCLLLRRIRR